MAVKIGAVPSLPPRLTPRSVGREPPNCSVPSHTPNESPPQSGAPTSCCSWPLGPRRTWLAASPMNRIRASSPLAGILELHSCPLPHVTLPLNGRVTEGTESVPCLSFSGRRSISCSASQYREALHDELEPKIDGSKSANRFQINSMPSIWSTNTNTNTNARKRTRPAALGPGA